MRKKWEDVQYVVNYSNNKSSWNKLYKTRHGLLRGIRENCRYNPLRVKVYQCIANDSGKNKMDIMLLLNKLNGEEVK